MILHAASIAAFFVDQTHQAQYAVNCAQAAPEPEWKWWLGVLAPWVGPLLSGGVSIYVAWKVFHWQGKRDFEQWKREQRKSEWSQLLRSIAEVERVLRMGATVYKDRISSIIDDLKPAIHEVVQAQANCIFLLNFFAGPKNYEKFFSFLKKAEMISNEVDGWRDVVRNPLLGTNEQIEKEKGENLMRIVKLCDEITSEYFDFQMWLRQEAARDLAVVE